MIKPDPRLWTPDESCIPFHLESSTSNTTRRLIDFEVYPNTIAVFTSLIAMQFHNAVANTKDQVRINIAKSVSQSGLEEGSVSLNGFLGKVIERGANANDNVAGFVCNIANNGTIPQVPRPIRIILEPGLYFVQQIGSVVAGAMLVCLHGYGFIENRQ